MTKEQWDDDVTESNTNTKHASALGHLLKPVAYMKFKRHKESPRDDLHKQCTLFYKNQ